MNPYKLWKPDARLDYSSDRPPTKSHHSKNTESRSKRPDGKTQSSSRGYVSDGPVPRAPVSTYPSNTLPSSSKASHITQPIPSQHPSSSSHRPHPSGHSLLPSTSSHPHKNPEVTYDSRTYPYRATATEKAALSLQDPPRPTEDQRKSSRQRSQQDHSPSAAVNGLSQTPALWAPSSHVHKVPRRPVPAGLDKERESSRARDAERVKEAERAGQVSRAREKDRADRAREDALREQEYRNEEERRQRREERYRAKEREREERRREEDRQREQRARDDLYRQEQSRDVYQDRDRRHEVKEPSRNHNQSYVPSYSRSNRVKESDESDNSLRKPVASLRHRRHHKEPTTAPQPPLQPVPSGSVPQGYAPPNVLANHPENIPYASSSREQRRQTTPVQLSQPLLGSSERPVPKHAKSTHSQNEAVPYPPGYAVSGGDNEVPKKDWKKQESSRPVEPPKVSPPRRTVVPSPNIPAIRPSDTQQPLLSGGRNSQVPESKGLGHWLFNRSAEVPAEKPPDSRLARTRTTSSSKPPAYPSSSSHRPDHGTTVPQMVSIKAGQGPSDQPLHDQIRKRSTPLQTNHQDAPKRLPGDASGTQQISFHMQVPVESLAQTARSRPSPTLRADPPDRSPAPQPVQPQAWSGNPQWSNETSAANGSAYRPVPSPAIATTRLPPAVAQAEPVRTPVVGQPYQSSNLPTDLGRPPPSPYLAPMQGRVPSSETPNTWNAGAMSNNTGLHIPMHVPGTRQRTSPQGPSVPVPLNSTPSHGVDTHQGRPTHLQESPTGRTYVSPPSNGVPHGSYSGNVASHPPQAPVQNSTGAVAPDLPSAFPIYEDAIEPYRRSPSVDHARHPQPSRNNTYPTDSYAFHKDVNPRQDPRQGTAPVAMQAVDSRPVRSTKTPSPGQQSRSVPHNTPPKTVSQPVAAPVPPPQPMSTSDSPHTYDNSRSNAYASVPAYPTPAAYPQPSPRTHLEANSAPYSTNVANPPASYYPSPRSANPSPRSQIYPMIPSQGPPPPMAAHVTQRTPSHETGSTTLLGHTPSSQGSLLMPSTSPAAHPQNLGSYPSPYGTSQPSQPPAPTHNRSHSAATAAPPPTVRQSSSRHQHSSSVPSPAIPPSYSTGPPSSQAKSNSQPSGPHNPVSPTPVRSYSTTQALGDPYATRVPVSGHPSTPAPVRNQQRRLISSPSQESDALNTPSSLAHSNLKLPDLAPIAPVMSIQSYQEPKKKSFFGLFRSKSTTAKQQQQQQQNVNPMQATQTDARGQQQPSTVKSSSKTAPPLQYESDSKATSMSRKRMVPPPESAPVRSTDKKASAPNPFASFRLLSGKRHRTMSGASAEAVDGTNAGASTVLTSPAGSTRSPTPKLPPPTRDPIQAANEWRNKEEAAARDRGSARRRRPGVHFEGYEDHPQAEKNKPNYAARVRAR